MTRRQNRVFFIGTCRLYEPRNLLEDGPDEMFRAVPHRFHTPGQVLRFVQHMSGRKLYTPQNAHLISDYAMQQIYEEGRPREELIERFEVLQSYWSTMRVFVIELSSLKEHHALHGGRRFVVNTFSARDQERHAARIAEDAAAGLSLPALPITERKLTRESFLRDMANIRTALGGRKVLWVSHARPEPQARYEAVNTARVELLGLLREGAARFGDPLYDPTELRAEMGAEAFFRDGGEDISHLSTESARRLAALYRNRADAMFRGNARV